MPSEPLRFRDIFLFQLGHADAIQRVVASHWSLVIGALFVFTAGIARNYDQIVLLRHGEKFAGPFIVSVISSVLVFIAIYKSGTRDWDRDDPPNFFHQYPGFLGAFLMTAPLAWFYAIPVEAMTDDLLSAAKWNVFLLSLVSLWRVWLITRVAQVITGTPFWRLLFPILIPASAEAYVGTFFAGFSLAGAMGGILPPDRQFTLDALHVILTGSGIVFLVSLAASISIAIGRWRVGEGWDSNFAGTWANPPKRALAMTAVLALLWVAIAFPWQSHLWNRVHLTHLVSDRNYDDAVAFLRSKKREDFPAGRALYAHPRYASENSIAQMLNQLGPDDPEWIASEYLETAEAAILMNLSMIKAQYSEETRNLVIAVGKSPGGQQILQAITEKMFQRYHEINHYLPPEDQRIFFEDLDAAGVEILDEWRSINPRPPPASAAGDTETTPAN